MKRLLPTIAVLLFLFFEIQGVTALSDRKIAILGDSMSWIGGDSCTNERGWTSHFKNKLKPGRIDMYARSGATWTNAAGTRKSTESYSEVLDDDNVVFNQALRLLEKCESDVTAKPDIIIIYAGANDAWFGKRHRPGYLTTGFSGGYPTSAEACDPSDFTTLESSVGLTCSLLQNRFEDARIILVTPVEMAKTTASNVHTVSDIIERTGKKMGLEVVRADKEVEIRNSVESKRKKYTTDGVHTNKEGARLIADCISSYLMSD